MTFDKLAAAVSDSSEVAPAFKLWVRNLRREREANTVDSAMCDQIADAIFRLCPEPDRPNFEFVATVLQSATSPAVSARMCRAAKCVRSLSLVTTVSTIARHYAKQLGYSDSPADMERCTRDITNGVLKATGLDGRLRGSLDCAWFTDTAQLDAKLSSRAPSSFKGGPSQADAVRALLGLSIPPAQRLVRLDLAVRDGATCAIAKPTTVDAAGYPYFVASRGDDEHGWTLDLDLLERCLPEWVISGIEASSATELRFLGTTGAEPAVDWIGLFERFDQGRV